MSLLRKPVRVLLALIVVLTSSAAEGGNVHAVLPGVLAALAVVLVTAKLAGYLFERLSLPAVLGELLAGVAIGNLGHLGFHGLDFVAADPFVGVLAELGVILLLFQVGLESNVGQMAKVGMSAMIVACIGVVVPMALGFAVAHYMLPGETWHGHVFIGAILTATSVGITARVLKDLGHLNAVEGRIILGAAVIDDVLGLVVLAVVKGIVAGAATGQGVGAMEVMIIIGKAVGFLTAALVVGGHLAGWVFRFGNVAYVPGVLLALSLALCFLGALAAHAVGLAPIVGAFAVGLVLDDVHYASLREREGHEVEELLHPIAGFLVPVFFVVTGAHVDLAVFTKPSVLGLAGLLTAAALLGKQACALVVPAGLNRLAIGIGMIPRGEVGLIFAATGAATLLPDGNPVVGPDTYAAVVVMVMVTTLVTPPLLAWQIRRGGTRPA